MEIVEGEMGMEIVVMMLRLVKGYMEEVKERERKVGWIYERKEGNKKYKKVMEGMNKREKEIKEKGIWEEWLRGIYEKKKKEKIINLVK